MIHCKDCRYFEERMDLNNDDGLCKLILPRQPRNEDYYYWRVRETDGCDLGQPREDYHLNPGSPTGS